MANDKLVKQTEQEFPTTDTILGDKLSPQDDSGEALVKSLHDTITVLKRDYSHMVRVANEKDNELRSYFRKNLPYNPHGASPNEVQLIYAEQRFIRAAKRCFSLISQFAGDNVFEFKSALENLEKTQARFPELLKSLSEEEKESIKKTNREQTVDFPEGIDKNG